MEFVHLQSLLELHSEETRPEMFYIESVAIHCYYVVWQCLSISQSINQSQCLSSRAASRL